MNIISELLAWLAGAAAVPRWAVAVGALGAMALLGSVVFCGWFLWFTRRMEAEAEHD